MKKNLLFIAFLLINTIIFSQNKAEWNGYGQIRASSNLINNYNISVKRLKLWVKSTPEFSEHWSYKIQAVMSSSHINKFTLEDVKFNYKIKNFSFDFGQLVPEYSLERFESDYKLPVLDRAIVIDRLIPNGTLGVRDVGVQANYATKNDFFRTHAGVFNGYGVNNYNIDNQGVMLTNKSNVNFVFNKNNLNLGYSLQYRKANNLQIPKVLEDTIAFSGTDFRYNFFLELTTQHFDFQTEYLNALIDSQTADGWYARISYIINKHQFVFAYSDYNDLISSTNDEAYYRIGYNYMINNYKMKIFTDYYFQFYNNKIQNNIASVQLQIFFL